MTLYIGLGLFLMMGTCHLVQGNARAIMAALTYLYLAIFVVIPLLGALVKFIGYSLFA